MPDGTTIKIFAPRIHKSNANEIRESADYNLALYTNKLIALACSTPPTDIEGLDERMREVWDLVEELREDNFRSMCADAIITFPDDCEDDLEACAECGQVGFHKMSCGSKEVSE